MEVKSNSTELEVELKDLVALFGIEDACIFHEENLQAGKVKNTFKLEKTGEISEIIAENDLPMEGALKIKSLRKRYAKKALYDLLSSKFNKKLPWGSLTGIRPTKLARELIQSGQVKEHLLTEYLQTEFGVSHEKALLVSKILKNQRGIIRNDKLVDIYLNIPICPSRCNYCSFISSEIGRIKSRVEEYIDCMIKEISAVKKIIFRETYIVRNIYIGGGTPTVLSATQLDRLLSEVTFPATEFTVECGRPETITREKLEVLKKHGVSRISINPQTFTGTTLKRIGRNHTVADVLEAYALALEFGFDVNMDVIVGLPGEGKSNFNKTVSTLLELYPDNITIHTLSLKKGSILKQEGASLSEKDLQDVLSKAENRLMDSGYKPYYLYRQKHQLGGLENVGFYRDDKICMFNIDSMEETASIIAIGANAMSKRVFSLENRIERSDNVKFVEDYISQIDEMIERKNKFFS